MTYIAAAIWFALSLGLMGKEVLLWEHPNKTVIKDESINKSLGLARAIQEPLDS